VDTASRATTYGEVATAQRAWSPGIVGGPTMRVSFVDMQE
jgi:hypothetical protein